MFVDISAPAGTRAVDAQVARGRRHGREPGQHTWVCEQRVCESEAATNSVRERVVARSRAGTTADGYEYLLARVCCMRTIPGNVRTDEAYLGGSDSITFINSGLNAI